VSDIKHQLASSFLDQIPDGRDVVPCLTPNINWPHPS